MRIAETWLRQDDTLDRWRHLSMLQKFCPFWEADKTATWLTVGDGRFGAEARHLRRQGVRVHASDMSATLLEIAHSRGMIDDFSEQNAEDLSFPSESFDYVLCKESAHHFPRPWIAIEEMIRVTRKAVLLCEPNDQTIACTPDKLVRQLLGRADHSFESVGNYVYTFSPREFEKFQLGAHRRWCAFGHANDHYFAGLEQVNRKGITRAKIRLRAVITIKDLACLLRLAKPQVLFVALFKQRPSSDLVHALRAIAWDVRELPTNPYL